MKIIIVNHGYPQRYNAGSEIYAQTLAHGLLHQGHKVAIFSRKEDSSRPEYEIEIDEDSEEPGIKLHLVNMANSRDRYRHNEVDARFRELVEQFRPDVVHVGHLNHLSTGIVHVASSLGVPTVFTLHDYWLMCPRGQFVQTNSGGAESWKLCDGQDDYKCAVSCYSRHFSGLEENLGRDTSYWTSWIGSRMAEIREVSDFVDLFIAPSQYLLERFSNEFGLASEKIVYLDYGFDHKRLTGRTRREEMDFVFGYIGTHTPQKGINLLIEAFSHLRGHARLRLWGRSNGQVTNGLKIMAGQLPSQYSSRVEWLPEYRNDDIIREVLNNVDAIVVPSIWVENSPLVIHEAQQARVPVIAADIGGMAEHVHHEVNGLLFAPRDPVDLARQMQRFVDDPDLAAKLGKRGYVKSDSGDVPSIEDHVTAVTSFYERVLRPLRVVA